MPKASVVQVCDARNDDGSTSAGIMILLKAMQRIALLYV
jgi:broad specificity polyphosphatase/5'/3'-nucleotidase SurE